MWGSVLDSNKIFSILQSVVEQIIMFRLNRITKINAM